MSEAESLRSSGVPIYSTPRSSTVPEPGIPVVLKNCSRRILSLRRGPIHVTHVSPSPQGGIDGKTEYAQSISDRVGTAEGGCPHAV